MWANGGWLRSWDGFRRGYTLVAPAGRVPTDPWNMWVIAKLCFTVFHGIAPSKRLVMSKVVKLRWHNNGVFITFLLRMLTPALASYRTWVTLKTTFVTKERGRDVKIREADVPRGKKWWSDLFWKDGNNFLVNKDVSHQGLGLPVAQKMKWYSQVCGGYHTFPTSCRRLG